MLRFFKKRSKNNKLTTNNIKSEINVVQKNNKLSLDIKLVEKYYIVKNIWLFNPNSNVEKKFPVIKTGSGYVFDMDNNKLLKELSNNPSSNTAEIFKSLKQTNTANKRHGLWNWYAEVVLDVENAPPNVYQKIIEQEENNEDKGNPTKWTKVETSYKKYVRIGKFKKTNVKGLSEVSLGDNTLLTYLNTHGYLVTAVDEEVSGKIRLQIEKLRTRKSNVFVEGRLNTGYFGVSNCKAVLKSRTTTNEYIFDVSMERNENIFQTNYGRNINMFELQISFDNLLEYQEDTYDLFLEVEIAYSQTPIRIRVGRPTFRAKRFFGEVSGISEEEMLLINPYYTIFQSNLSFEVFPFVEENYKYLKRISRFARMFQLLNRNKDVWLVGERPYKAQDTGFHFFKYMRENHPEKNVYYVISKDSPEYGNVAPLGNVLEFGSKEHIKNTIIATKIFSSHHADYLYPIRTKSFINSVRATRIFLQHGVFGVKNMSATYGKRALTFQTDMFITSSEYEKGYAIRDLNYRKQDVCVTGLSRFDALFENDVAVKRQVLIIPTWRDWLQNIESFLDSEYYKRYLSLVNNEELLRHSIENNYELVLCLHPNMQVFSSYFAESPVKIIYQGDEDVQKLIKESALMVTDYSSVAFDFSFLHKPVLYYQFDQARFIGENGSHIDLAKELPGELFENELDIIEKIKFYESTNFEMEEIYKKRANKFISHRDRNSSKRIYEAALNYRKKKELIEKLQESNLLKDLYRKVRGSKYYFPIMKCAYSIMRIVLPVNKKKVFLESGLGKNFSDSPKEIFEVLQNENHDLQYVWSYNRKLNKSYKNTQVIKRLSLEYYYHLATAGYWVNNQNFPTYIKKRKGTKYLQTWHGTPLKRMLHDLEEIHGRDASYLSRVSKAIEQWDYLVSPSEYATNCFRSAFKYNGQVLEEGYPRNDVFYEDSNSEKIHELKTMLNINPNKKVIIYAMTFRDNQKRGNKFVFDLPLDLKRFHERFGKEYVLLIRMHVVISKGIKIPEEYADSIIDVSNFPDIQQLLLLSDVLITDYSSVFFDFLNTDRPILFYTQDLAEYRDTLRGFYLDFEKEAPGPICLNESTLFDSIDQIEQVKEDYKDKYQKAKARFCYLDDGKVSSRIVNKVFK